MMDKKLFGTDGIRGKANVRPVTCEVAFLLGRAVTHHFQTTSNRERPLIIVGKDTRLSCYMLEHAFSAGVCSQGGEVILTGPLPTPGVAFVTKSMRSNAGVMISASHNPYYDNGIKIFDHKGCKLSDEIELELEEFVFNPAKMPTKTGTELGNAKRLKEVFGRYLVHCKAALSGDFDMEGLKVVLDCANGAGYKVSPLMLQELGAKVWSISVEPNGHNINSECGSLYPRKACELVLEKGADLGICLDGDADRLVVVDEKGKVVDGDRLIGLFARMLLDQGSIKKGDSVVGTVMSNLGLELYLNKLGLEFCRVQVGDRYIVEEMNKRGSVLGGEPSGHIIFKDYATTGDGTLSALKAVEAMRFYRKAISELTGEVALLPQVLKNIQIKDKKPLGEINSVQAALGDAQKKMGKRGRVVMRYSGTEAKVRVMVEGDSWQKATQVCDDLLQVVSSALN